MGFVLRKSLRMGPLLRLNVSKSGLGVSAGVKGARVGVNPKGRATVHAGRHGMYYRKSVSGKRRASSSGVIGSLAIIALLALFLAIFLVR